MSGTHQHDTPERAALVAAVADAVHAPSIFNTQPWWWRLDGSTLTLQADASRRLPVVDPEGMLHLVSCGAALHHARVGLAARGWAARVERMPGGSYGDEPLASLTLTGRAEPDPTVVALREAIAVRRTDRRPFGEEPVPAGVLAELEAAAVAEGIRLHRVRLDQMPMLSVAVAAAEASELASPRYRIELIQWTSRPEWSGDGVPPETAVRHGPRRVPVRDFALPSALASDASGTVPEQGMPVSAGGDRGATYLVLHGPGEERLDWLRAGEALSAVLLRATASGLASAVFTDVLEVDHPRDLVRGLLPGVSHPYALVRCGHATGTEAPPASPRRGVGDVLRLGTPAVTG